MACLQKDSKLPPDFFFHQRDSIFFDFQMSFLAVSSATMKVGNLRCRHFAIGGIQVQIGSAIDAELIQ